MMIYHDIIFILFYIYMKWNYNTTRPLVYHYVNIPDAILLNTSDAVLHIICESFPV